MYASKVAYLRCLLFIALLFSHTYLLATDLTLAYVINQIDDTVSVINMETQQVAFMLTILQQFPLSIFS